MGFPKFSYFTILLIYALIILPLKAQVVFKELPNYQINSSDSSFFDIGSTRSIIPLDGNWFVYPSGDKGKNKVTVSVPSIFQGNGDLVFEKYFTLTKDEINNHTMKLVFLGLNYTADISINGVIIYRHSGGSFPFSFDLPRDILGTENKNVLSVRLFYKLDSESTIPLKQRFLYPQNFGGIIRDVFIRMMPTVAITDVNLTENYNHSSDKVRINLYTKISDNAFYKDSTSNKNGYTLKLKFISPNGGEISAPDNSFQISPNKDKEISQSVDISSPVLWSPSLPKSYKVYFELWNGNNLIDRSKHMIAVYSLLPGTNSFTLNGEQFQMNGVTYVPSFGEYGNLATYSQMENDIRMIKNLGFNAVRFAKELPHPYYLSLCEKYGLLAFIEMPLNLVPEQLAADQNFISRCKNYLSNFLYSYQKYSAVAAVGLGGSYLPNSNAQMALLKTLGALVKNNSNLLTYASFGGLNISPVGNIDLYGINLLNEPVSSIGDQLKNLQSKLGEGRVFISAATYIVNIGNTTGYVNEHSYEAQAKYFDDLIDYASNNPLAGYFINSMFDYRGDCSSLIGGYNKDNLYHIGICDENRGTDRLAYKVIYSKFHNSENVTIPIGTASDDAPMIFIIAGLLLAIIMGIIVNSGRKFREDSSRALLRPYNFFADVRDQRIMSGYQTTALAFIVSAVTALTISNLLFYFRESVVLEKLLLCFGSAHLIKIISYLSWHPGAAMLWLTVVFIALIIALTIIVKIASFFVRNHVFYSGAYFVVIWSFLPFVLLIPLGIVLYRVLSADVINIYVYLLLVLFIIWAFYRLMKGVYVIFDVNAGSVYFYSIIIILACISVFLIYYQMKNSVVDYLQLTFKQYNILR